MQIRDSREITSSPSIHKAMTGSKNDAYEQDIEFEQKESDTAVMMGLTNQSSLKRPQE